MVLARPASRHSCRGRTCGLALSYPSHPGDCPATAPSPKRQGCSNVCPMPFRSSMPLLLALVSVLLTASCVSEVPNKPTAAPLPAPAPTTPKRIVSVSGETTNVCVDELGDSGYGSNRGFDIETVTISRDESSFTYSFRTRSPVSTGTNIRGSISISSLNDDSPGLSLTTFFSARGYTVNAWTAATGDNFIQGESTALWTGSELTTTISIGYLQALGFTDNFKWNAFVAYRNTMKDACPSGEFGSYLVSAF